MNDVSSVPAPAPADLTYPLGSPPLPGQSYEVAPGVHWLRMPLPMSLNHINLWALEDGDGWTLVDTGMRTDEIASAWQNIMSELMADRPVKRVICTHMHPDHIGMAGWLTRRFDCQLWITRLEYLTCRTLVSDMGREAPADALRFYHAAGWDGEAIERYKTRFGHFGKVVYTLPDSFRRICDGDEILIGGRNWRVVVGRGHSPEHACLYSPELSVLISGDQVLPKITSNVSVFPTEPEADPLTDWLESLAAIRLRIPDDVLVLPSHNEPFRGMHARIAQLIAGHEQALLRVKDALAEPKTATDLFSILFRRRIAGDLLSMATGESVAHLNCLIHRGHATRTTDATGVQWYRST